MSNATKRDGDISRLHPAIRDRVAAIQKKLNDEGIPFRVFEAFRTPQRQAYLWNKGRNGNPGPKVTWVGPWRSIHQYGLAVDFVLFENGKWSWDDSGAKRDWWHRMHAVAKEHDMTPLFNSKGQLIEMPHIQLFGVSAKELFAGNYPDGGDDIWAEHLSDLIDGWDGHSTPPKPERVPEKPAIDESLVADLEDGGEAPDMPEPGRLTLSTTEADAMFARLHAFIRDAEGGFVNHPDDTGGATNFGITIETLRAWRGRDVTEEDVRSMRQSEADAILRANYYTRCRCGEMPERMAMVVYNSAVMSGPDKAIRFLQTAFNKLGMTADDAPLEVDGIIGTKTMAAAQQTDAEVLASTYLDVYEAYLRQRPNWDTFGRGWGNRISKLREFLTTLPKGAGKRPTKVMKIAENRFDLDLDIETDDIVRLVLAGATGGKSAVARAVLRRALAKRAGESAMRAGGKDIVEALIEERIGLDIDGERDTVRDTVKEKVLTPVNAALGERVGRALDGKKSVTGIVGLVLTAVLPELGILNAETIDVIRDGDLQTIFFTLLSIFTGWGFLGKIDKAIREVKDVVRQGA
ncbi:glycosyl hydrolase 108 family protein [Roseobacteraceae bacterium S113]